MKRGLTILVLVMLCAVAAKSGFFGGHAPFYREKAVSGAPVLSPQRRIHILYGDGSGGGHIHGVNRPCKSEFPAGWRDSDIIAAVGSLAANDNMNWQEEGNGYYTAEETVKGVRVRVVLGHDRRDIITAYPTNQPQNACPSAH